MQSQYAYRRNDSHLLNGLALIIIFYLVGDELCLKLSKKMFIFGDTNINDRLNKYMIIKY